jgi:hypothetical protein
LPESAVVIWIVFAIVSVAGTHIARRDPTGARQASRLLPLVLAFFLGVMAATGVFFEREAFAKLHRWMADTTVFAMWISVAFCSGTIMQREIRRRPFVALAQLLAILAAFALLGMNAVSGFIDPATAPSKDPEMLQAFHALHRYVLPVMLYAILAEWWWFFGPARPNSTSTPEKPAAQEG